MLLFVLGGINMFVNIENLLIERKVSLSHLAREVGCNYSSLLKLVHNETKSIQFELLENICIYLECGVEDILKLGEKDK
jgi:putative transcriptional regulator